MSLRGRRAAFGLLAAADLIALLYSGDAVYLWIFVFLGVLLLVGWLQVLITLRSFSLRLELPDGRVMSGQRASIGLTAKLDMLLPPAHLAISFITADPRRDNLSVFASPLPGRPASAEVEFSCPYRGEYKIGVGAVEATDLLGLVRMRRQGAALRGSTGVLAVYPRTYDITDRMLDLRMNEGAEEGARADTEEISSVADLRGWRDGDSLKRVHWKLSARAGSLIVKEYDGSFDARNMIFLDATSRAGYSTQERMASCAASFARLFCNAGRRVRLTCYGETRTDADSGDGGFAALHLALARVKFGGELDAGSALRLECDDRGAPDSLVIVTPEPGGALIDSVCALSDRGTRVTVAVCSDDDTRGARDVLRRHGVRMFIAPAVTDGDSEEDEPEGGDAR